MLASDVYCNIGPQRCFNFSIVIVVVVVVAIIIIIIISSIAMITFIILWIFSSYVNYRRSYQVKTVHAKKFWEVFLHSVDHLES